MSPVDGIEWLVSRSGRLNPPGKKPPILTAQGIDWVDHFLSLSLLFYYADSLMCLKANEDSVEMFQYYNNITTNSNVYVLPVYILKPNPMKCVETTSHFL
jgi:hypothetical protein